MKKLVFLLLFVVSTTHASPISVYFSPDDNLQNRLIELIDGEKKEIKIAIYTFTNRRIASALNRAKERGVRVELVADVSSAKESLPYGTLEKKGAKVHTFFSEATRPSNRALMHHKFALFRENERGEHIVWTGSFNFTYKATRQNRENAVVFSDQNVYTAFSEEFKRLISVPKE